MAKFNTLLRQIPRLRPSNTPLLHSLSTQTSTKPFYYKNPGRYVQGITTADLETNPAIAEFFAANMDEDDDVANVSNPSYVPTPTPKEATENEKLAEMELGGPSMKRNVRPLLCSLRDPVKEEGSIACRRLRSDNWVPGLIHGRSYEGQKMSDNQVDERVFVKTEWKRLQKEKDKFGWDFRYRVYELRFEEEDDVESILVTPQNVNIHPVWNMFFCANYLRYYPGRAVQLPFRFVNEEDSATLKQGGFIIPLKRTVEVIIEEGATIPNFLPVDCTDVKRKQVLKLDRVILPEGIKIAETVDQNKFMVGTSRGKKLDKVLGEEDTEE